MAASLLLHLALLAAAMQAATAIETGALDIGTDGLLASTLNSECADEHGTLFDFEASKTGFILLTGLELEGNGVQLVPSSIGTTFALNWLDVGPGLSVRYAGGGCNAKVFQACPANTSCPAVVACNDSTDRQRCLKCHPASFQSRFRGSVCSAIADMVLPGCNPSVEGLTSVCCDIDSSLCRLRRRSNPNENLLQSPTAGSLGCH